MVNSLFSENCSVYEIYPQNETPHLIEIAHIDLDPSKDPLPHVLLLPGMVVWSGLNEHQDKTIFRVWDYQLSHSISFSMMKFSKQVSKYILSVEIIF